MSLIEGELLGGLAAEFPMTSTLGTFSLISLGKPFSTPDFMGRLGFLLLLVAIVSTFVRIVSVPTDILFTSLSGGHYFKNISKLEHVIPPHPALGFGIHGANKFSRQIRMDFPSQSNRGGAGR